MKYKACLDYLYNLPRYGRSHGHHRLKIILDQLENPHRKFPSLLVGGTNGKGSVSALLHSIFTAAGLDSGLFTSPHLHRFNERFRRGRAELTDEKIAEVTEKLHPPIESLRTKGDLPSGFEAFTALAFLAFADPPVDIAVLEVGVGGRLDPTSIVHPLASVITNVDLEHTEILGETKGEIGREKLGLVHPQKPLFSAETDGEVLSLMKEKCTETGSPLFLLNRDFTTRSLTSSLEGQSLEVQTPFSTYSSLFTPLAGSFQLPNLALAVTVADYLRAKEILPLTGDDIARGLAQVHWPGRLELLSTDPVVVADSAHNLPGIQALVDALQTLLPPRGAVLLAGFSKNKPYGAMLEALAPLAEEVVLSQASHKGVSPKKVAETVASKNLFGEIKIEANLSRALAVALDKTRASRKVLIVAGGLFFAAETRSLLAKKEG